MKIRELKEQLERLIAEDEFLGDANVTFGEDREPIAGGIIGTKEGLVELNLAPIKLDRLNRGF